MPEQKTEPKLFGFYITWEEVKELIKPNRNPEGIIKLILTVIGVVLTPVVLFGVLFGYKRAYKRFYATEALMPYLNNLKPIAKFAMALGGIGIIVVCYFAYQLIAFVSGLFLGSDPRSYIFILLYFLVMLVFTLAVLLSFNKWRDRILDRGFERGKYGTAEWATNSQLQKYESEEGIYIGAASYAFRDKGHILTVAGTRGGKGTNLIITKNKNPNYSIHNQNLHHEKNNLFNFLCIIYLHFS